MPPDATLDALRARIRTLELGAGGGDMEAVPLAVPAIDGALPWGGLPRGALHEIVAGGPGVGEGFAAALLAQFIEGRGPALWCLARGDLFGPGLGAVGLAPHRQIITRARHADDVLWAMEEGLRSGVPGAVLGEPRGLDLAAGRRLQLAARAGSVACLVLRLPGITKSEVSVAVTRWRVDAAPSLPLDELPGLGAPRWRVGLLRCRGAVPREWLLEWNNETCDFAVVSLLGERAADSPPTAFRETA
ncbi:MAG: damage-inducible mutagenesis protein [Pseudomonadota bacterium]|nr:damage-inducible mutagenesis protein [Pseudomonadota bacterium]